MFFQISQKQATVAYNVVVLLCEEFRQCQYVVLSRSLHRSAWAAHVLYLLEWSKAWLTLFTLLTMEAEMCCHSAWPASVCFSSAHRFARKRSEAEGEGDRGRQTICALVWFFFRSDVSEIVDQCPGRCLDPAPFPCFITAPASAIIPRELIDLRTSCQRGLGPCRQPHSAVFFQLSAVLLCTLDCLHFHLKGSYSENLLEALAYNYIAQMTASSYKRIKWTAAFTGADIVPHPNCSVIIVSFQNSFRTI